MTKTNNETAESNFFRIFLFFAIAIFLRIASDDLFINYTFISFPLVLGFLLTTKRYVIFWFCLFIYSIPLVAYFLIYISNFDFSSWRQGQITKNENASTLLQLAEILVFIALCICFTSKSASRTKKIPENYYRNLLYYPGSRSRIRMIVYCSLLFPYAVYASVVLGKGRDLWLQEADSSGILIVNFSFLVMYFVLAYALTFRRDRIFDNIMIGAMALIGILFAVSGFRYALVGMVLIAITSFLQKSSFRVSRIFLFIPMGLIFYAALIIIAISRNLDKTPFEIVSLLINGSIPMELLVGFLGGHEQSIYYSYSKVLHSSVNVFGELYMDSFLRILPSFIYSNLFETVRISALINEIAAPDQYIGTVFNLGGFFLAEAVINFGVFGSYFVVLISIYLFSKLESVRYKKPFNMVIYLTAIANIPNFVYYGSNSILKIMFYVVFLTLLLRIIAAQSLMKVRVNKN